MSSRGRSRDEREVASIVAGLHHSSGSSDAADVPASKSSKKRARGPAGDAPRAAKKPAAATAEEDPPIMDATARVFLNPRLTPAPYFYYTDHSFEVDDDPLTPITSAGSVPTFPAKMHAILTNPALAGVVGWAPHGRSWRIIKPRQFEVRILPKYFEHSKFSSFVRQANGWGFRRMAQGNDKNAYYHEYFLRAMPWLCKQMRRPKVSEKKAVDPATEPHFDAISRQYPVPDGPPTREVIVLRKTIERGPRARMPVLWDTDTPPAAPSSPAPAPEPEPAPVRDPGDGDLKPAARPDPPAPAVPAPQAVVPALQGPPAVAAPVAVQAGLRGSRVPPASFGHAAAAPANDPGAPPADPATDPFAAGFMVATAYHSSQMRSMLGDAFVAGVNNGNTAMPMAGMNHVNRVMPPAASAAAGAGVTTADLRALLLQRAGRGRSNLHPSGNTVFAARARSQGHPDAAALRAAAALYGPGGAAAALEADARGLQMPLPGSLSDAHLRPRGHPDVAAALGAAADARGLYGPNATTAADLRVVAETFGLEVAPLGSRTDARLRHRGRPDFAAALGAAADTRGLDGACLLEMLPRESLSDARLHPPGHPDISATRGLYGPGVTAAAPLGAAADVRSLEMPQPGVTSDTRLRPQGCPDAAAAFGDDAGVLCGPGVATANSRGLDAARGLERMQPGSLSNQLLQRLQQLQEYQARF